MRRLILLIAVAVAANLGVTYLQDYHTEGRRDLYIRQADNDDAVPALIRDDAKYRHWQYGEVNAIIAVFGLMMFAPEIHKLKDKACDD